MRELITRQVPFIAFDRDGDLRRLDQLVPGRPDDIEVVTGDIADVEAVCDLVAERKITAIIHLAALQMPFCRPDPTEGARVNVLGTIAVFEAARRLGTLKQICYASSAAVFGPEELYGGATHLGVDAPLAPATHYGVFKQANEGAARVYFQDDGVSSIGLRPWTVYGLGRDQGVTSDATSAVRAAVRGEDFTLRYSGRNALQYARDVAAAFVLCALDDRPGARLFNLRGEIVDMTEFIAKIERHIPEAKGRIRLSGGPIPVVCDLDDSELRAFLPSLPTTSLTRGIEETIADFRRLEGR